MTLLAYHNDKKIKSRLLRQLKAHYDADEIVQGYYWEEGKGCAVGCTIHGDDHARYETELGIPQVIARLEDCIFEGLKNGAAKQWPQRFAKAITPGADLSLVWPLFALWMLREKLPLWAKHKSVLASINETALVYEAWIKTGAPDHAAACAASCAAACAAACAASCAAYAACAGAYDAAYDFWTEAADKLIELLKAA